MLRLLIANKIQWLEQVSNEELLRTIRTKILVRKKFLWHMRKEGLENLTLTTDCGITRIKTDGKESKIT